MIIGFTGTSQGMNAVQSAALAALLDQLRPVTIMHGDCIGADAEFHDFARRRGAKGYIILPGMDGFGRSPKRARCVIPDDCLGLVEAPQPYLRRNRVIAETAQFLIAVPKERDEQFRGSGTWSTIRYARSARTPHWILYPDGVVQGHAY